MFLFGSGRFKKILGERSAYGWKLGPFGLQRMLEAARTAASGLRQAFIDQDGVADFLGRVEWRAATF